MSQLQQRLDRLEQSGAAGEIAMHFFTVHGEEELAALQPTLRQLPPNAFTFIVHYESPPTSTAATKEPRDAAARAAIRANT